VKRSGDLGAGVVHDWRLTRLHNAFQAKHGQHPTQRFRVASPNTLLSATKAQESIHDVVVQHLYFDVFVLQPPAEIGDGDDLPSDRVASIALFGDSGRVSVEVFAQRTLANPFNGAWKSEELVYHPSRVSGACPKLCRVRVAETPMIGRWNFNMRHSPGRGIVAPMPHAA
jgi:hypothetical protein